MARRKITPNDIAADLPNLTASQQEFVHLLAGDPNASKAYRSAYNCENMAPASISVEASRLMANPKIALWLSAIRQAHLGRATLSLDEHLRELERLKEISVTTGNIGAAVQAEQLRGKASGHYVDQVKDVTGHSGDTLNEIAKLSPELAKALALDALPEGSKH